MRSVAESGRTALVPRRDMRVAREKIRQVVLVATRRGVRDDGAAMGRLGLGRIRMTAALAAIFVATHGCRSRDASTNGCSDYASAFCARMAACLPLDLRTSFA